MSSVPYKKVGERMHIEILKSRLQLYLAAEAAILRGQEYRLGDRSLRRADLSEVRKMIDYLSEEIERLEGGNIGKRIKRAVLVDD